MSLSSPEAKTRRPRTGSVKIVIIAGLILLLAAAVGGIWYFRRDIAHEIALFQGKRAIASKIATPIVLSQGQMSPVWDGIPSDFQVFNHVPLQIDGGLLLWGEGNAKAGEAFPEQIEGIQFHQKFETLYVYHATFYGSLPKTPVYQIVFRYVGGLSETNTLLYNDDVLDFVTTAVGKKPYLAPKSPHSKVAWVGGYFRETDPRPLRFCLTAIENPHPDVEVLSLDLYSCKNRSAACILAMTAGRSGLMK